MRKERSLLCHEKKKQTKGPKRSEGKRGKGEKGLLKEGTYTPSMCTPVWMCATHPSTKGEKEKRKAAWASSLPFQPGERRKGRGKHNRTRTLP